MRRTDHCPGCGVDGAIRRAAGPKLLEACRGLYGCRTGEAKITFGCDLPAKHVIYTVEPGREGGDPGEEELPAACYTDSLRLVMENGLRTVAFPSVSAGAYGYPLDETADVSVGAVFAFAREHPGAFDRIEWAAFGMRAYRAFAACIAEHKNGESR